MNSAPALVALYGRIYDPSNLGGIAMLKMTAFGAVLVAVLMLLTVIRHTRGDEEEGRTELLRAGVVGRRAPLVAALILTLGASLLLGLLTALALVAAGLDARGAWAFGLSWACAGAAFAAVGAVAAQLTASARAARGVGGRRAGRVVRAARDRRHLLAGVAPGGCRGSHRSGGASRSAPSVGTAGGSPWSPWCSPRWRSALAVALLDRRDLGSGLVQPRPGPSRAGRGLGTPLGLAWRLHRASFLAWLSGFVVLALVLGNMASSLGGLLDSPGARDLITRMGGVQGLTDAFLSTEIGAGGVAAAAYGVQAVLRLRAEESALRAEPVLATGVTRCGVVHQPRAGGAGDLGRPDAGDGPLRRPRARCAHRGRARHGGHHGGCGARARAGRLGRDRTGRGRSTGCCRGPRWWRGWRWWPSSSSASWGR